MTASEKPNVGMAPIDDDRLGQVGRVVGARKATPAAVRVVDVPGTGAALLGNLRQVDALLAVLNGFAPTRIPRPTSRRSASSCSWPTATTSSDGSSASRSRRSRAILGSGRRSTTSSASSPTSTRAAARRLAGRSSRRAEPLTTKPLLPLENGPGGVDGRLEAELAELDPEEAAAFREGESRSARSPAVCSTPST